jgi:hypothetical protein
MTSARAAVTVILFSVSSQLIEWGGASSRTSTCYDFVTAAKAALLSLHYVKVLNGSVG